MNDYNGLLKLLKAMSEPTRLQILDILSCGTLCACDILESLNISQSTLSHHMKVLMDSELVIGEKDATWMHYTLNENKIKEFHTLIDQLTISKNNCICRAQDNLCR